MNVDLGIWSKLSRAVVFLLFVAGILGIALWYLPLIQQNEQYRKRIMQLDKEIQKEEETGKQLKAAIDALRRDPKAVERLARERFSYSKPGETVIRFEPAVTNAPRMP
jgi:cell division protein FtsB